MSHCAETTPTMHRATVHYTVRNGNNQYQLQLLAADILKYGTHVGDTRHYAQEFEPNGAQRVIDQGTTCTEVINELTGSRYWVHLSGCKVTEIIEEYAKERG